jgi:hypothetical protein
MATPNMNLTLPLVSQTPGPLWASEINADMTIIDGHDHIATGVPIVSAALNINDDLSFNSHALLDAINVSFIDGGPTGVVGIPNSLQTAAGELYFTDGNGNSVQITDNGTVNVGGTGNIGGIVPNAAVNYVSGPNNYEFLDENGNRAALDISAVVFGGNVTLQLSPYSLSYVLKLPAALPSATSFVTATVSGSDVTLGYLTQANGITRPMQAAVGQQVSSWSSHTVTSTSSFGTLSSSVTLTCTGRPIVVGLISEPNTSPNYAYLEVVGSAAGLVGGQIHVSVSGSATTKILASSIEGYANGIGNGLRLPITSFSGIYVPPSAGTYTFAFEGKCTASGGGYVTTTMNSAYVAIYAYEL